MAARAAGFVTLEGYIGPMGAGLWAAGPISFVVPRPMVHGPAFGDAGLAPALAVHSGPPMPVPDPIETVAPSAITRVTFPSDFASSPSDSFIRV